MVMFICPVEMASPDKSGSVVSFQPKSEDVFYRSKTLKTNLRREPRTRNFGQKTREDLFGCPDRERAVVCSYGDSQKTPLVSLLKDLTFPTINIGQRQQKPEYKILLKQTPDLEKCYFPWSLSVRITASFIMQVLSEDPGQERCFAMGSRDWRWDSEYWGLLWQPEVGWKIWQLGQAI